MGEPLRFMAKPSFSGTADLNPARSTKAARALLARRNHAIAPSPALQPFTLFATYPKFSSKHAYTILIRWHQRFLKADGRTLKLIFSPLLAFIGAGYESVRRCSDHMPQEQEDNWSDCDFHVGKWLTTAGTAKYTRSARIFRRGHAEAGSSGRIGLAMRCLCSRRLFHTKCGNRQHKIG